MKISLSIESTRNKSKKNTAHYAHDTEHKEQKSVHHDHHDELTEHKNVQQIHDTERTEHNRLDTNLLCLYNEDRFFK